MKNLKVKMVRAALVPWFHLKPFCKSVGGSLEMPQSQNIHSKMIFDHILLTILHLWSGLLCALASQKKSPQKRIIQDVWENFLLQNIKEIDPNDNLCCHMRKPQKCLIITPVRSNLRKWWFELISDVSHRLKAGKLIKTLQGAGQQDNTNQRIRVWVKKESCWS